MIDDLLDVARIRTGRLSVAPEPADIARLVDRARVTFLSGGGSNDLHLDLAADLPPVMADPRRIVQVLDNLLSNAARHSPASSPIRVTAVREGVQVAVSVADRGRGISPERMSQLFGKFSRTGRDGARQTGGAGLGLAICKGIVEAHGGRIRAESDGPGLGARFTFWIPAVEETAAEAGLPPSQKPPEGKPPILVVDDDPQTLTSVQHTLAGAGFEPTVTADPDQVARLLEEHRPHLVLLDLVLPGSDGIELIRDLLGPADVPVIAMTGYRGDPFVSQAFETGAADYLAKPFSPTELVARVRAVLRRREATTRVEPANPYVHRELIVDYARRLVTVAGRRVHLTASEYRLLFELSVNAGRVVPYDRLLRKVTGRSHSPDRRTVRTLLKKLRRKLHDRADNPTYLFTERGVGCRMPKGESNGAG